MKTSLLSEIKRAAYEVPRLYFAPITGAIKGIRREYKELDESFAKRRRELRQQAADRNASR